VFDTILERVARALDEAAIPYMVIGGQAVLLYGEPRLTRSIDVTLGIDLDRLDDLLIACDHAGLRPLVDAHTFTPETRVLPCQDAESGVRADLLLSFTPYERDAIARARSVVIGGTTVRFVTPEDLVVHKIVAGRPRDIEDVRHILLKNPDLDAEYLWIWLREFAYELEHPYDMQFETLLGETRT
jgi:hypothetical protein